MSDDRVCRLAFESLSFSTGGSGGLGTAETAGSGGGGDVEEGRNGRRFFEAEDPVRFRSSSTGESTEYLSSTLYSILNGRTYKLYFKT